jgi:D-tyrosyl-tRNA(Tyr) deacylase
VHIEGKLKAEIGAGLLVLLGIESSDNSLDIEWLSGKIARLRIFADTAQNMNLSVKDVGGSVLVVSQFTLHASTRKGNRPSFIKAAQPLVAEKLYHDFVENMEAKLPGIIQTGVFGAMMEIELVNSGPVTLILDSKSPE